MGFDPVSYILGAKSGGGGGGGVTVEPITITENGTKTAPAGKAYSPVSVDVPNSYAAGDEGKVVSNGALVAQTARTVDANGTYDTTTNNSVEVDLPGPGWSEFTVAMNTTNSEESFSVLFHDTQEGKTYVAIINKDKKDFVNNQLLQCIARNTGAVVTSWIGAYVRNRANNAAMAGISATYDAAMRVGDKYLISEVDGG